MTGMNRRISTGNPLVVSSFHSALVHQLLLIAAVLLGLALAWNVAFTLQQRRRTAGPLRAASGSDNAGARTPGPPRGAPGATSATVTMGPEPAGRRILRISFGLLWLLDGLLQLQNAMPLGFPQGVLVPADSGSPSWVHTLTNTAVTIWSDHPVQAAAAAVWVQVGIGLALLVAPRGVWSRTAGLVSAGWGLVVWMFAEAFGGLFGHGQSWLFGFPGAVVFYALAGVLIALPESAWEGRRLGRAVTATYGVFLVGMAILQAWPGRGFWQGGGVHGPGSLEAMVRTMSTTPQPRVVSSSLSDFAAFDAAHGWGVNLFVVVALGLTGALFVWGHRRAVLVATAALGVLSLAVWLLVQDLGFLGGVGTDPNSMLPGLALAGGGTVALLRHPVRAAAHGAAPGPATAGVEVRPMTRRLSERWASYSPGALARIAACLAAFFVVAVGVVPMASAATSSGATAIVTEALNGTPNLVNAPAPPIALSDQYGHPVSLASLRGKAVALTFLDPVCTSDCPLIAQAFRRADQLLATQSSHTAFIAVVANPLYRSKEVVDSFDHQEGLTGVRNWLYLTGSLQALSRVWNRYGVEVQSEPAGAMVDHSEVAYVIDPQGRIRAVLGADPGDTSSARSSLSDLVAQELRALLP